MKMKVKFVMISLICLLNLVYGKDDGIVIENFTTKQLSPGNTSLISLVENDYSPIIYTQELDNLSKYYDAVKKNKDFQFRNINNKLYGYFIFESRNHEAAADLQIHCKIFEVINIMEDKYDLLAEKQINLNKEDFQLIVNAQTDSVRHSIGYVLSICDFEDFNKKPNEILGGCEFKITNSNNEIIYENDLSLFLLSETKLNNLLMTAHETFSKISNTEYVNHIDNAISRILLQTNQDNSINKEILSHIKTKIKPDLEIVDVSIRSKPEFIIEIENQLQVKLPTLSNFKINESIIQIRTVHFGISNNNGQSWYFIDMTYLDTENLELLVPKLSKLFK